MDHSPINDSPILENSKDNIKFSLSNTKSEDYLIYTCAYVFKLIK